MKRRLFAVARVFVLAAFLPAFGPAHRAATISPTDPASLAKLPPEVRLRKLHLVRPDLIQYPISYEVYC
jgi:hypothetical protein